MPGNVISSRENFYVNNEQLEASKSDEGSFTYLQEKNQTGTHQIGLTVGCTAFTVLTFDVFVDGEYYDTFSQGVSPTMDTTAYFDFNVLPVGDSKTYGVVKNEYYEALGLEIWSDLIKTGYIDEEGFVTEKFSSLTSSSEMFISQWMRGFEK